MKNFEKKETNLKQLIEKLAKLNISYSQDGLDNKFIEKERDLIESEKNQLEKKNLEILREHKYLTEKVKKLEQELKSKRNLRKSSIKILMT